MFFPLSVSVPTALPSFTLLLEISDELVAAVEGARECVAAIKSAKEWMGGMLDKGVFAEDTFIEVVRRASDIVGVAQAFLGSVVLYPDDEEGVVLSWAQERVKHFRKA